MSSLQSDVMCLDPKQINKTSKTLLDIRARCVGGRIKFSEGRGNPETDSVKSQVSSARRTYILSTVEGRQGAFFRENH